jgi:hypothetical protein
MEAHPRDAMGRARQLSLGFGDSGSDRDSGSRSGSCGRGIWEVGLLPMPATVALDDGSTVQPLLVLVMEKGGAIRANAVGHPDDPGELVEEALDEAIDQPPPPCTPGEPSCVVVNDARLLELLPPLLPGVPVTQGATPQIDQARSALREQMAGGQGGTGMEALTTYLTEDVTPEAMAGLFEAAAELYRRRPWERVPDDGHLFQVSCGALGMRGWTGCVIGQNREHYGVVLFESLQDYGRYVVLGERAQQGDEDAMREAPPHRAINFESKRDMPRPLLKEIQQHRWPVAAGDAFPTVMLVHPDLLLAPPLRADVRQLELVVRALVAWLDAEPQLAEQWQRLPPRRRRFRVPMGTMTLPVTIGAVPDPDLAKTASAAAALDPGDDGHLEAFSHPRPRSLKVPAALRERVEALMARIDPFCDAVLNDNYRELIHAALAALARKRPSPLLSGREPSWCAGVVMAIGSANFLFDSSQTPHCTASIIQKHFGVSSSAAHAHAKKVRDLLGISPFSLEWCLPSLLESSSIPWMLEVDGFLQDVRTLPIEIQAEACARGLIPDVPAMREGARGNMPAS